MKAPGCRLADFLRSVANIFSRVKNDREILTDAARGILTDTARRPATLRDRSRTARYPAITQ